MIEEEDNHLDESLRQVFEDFQLPPAEHLWTGIAQRLPGEPEAPAPKRRPLPLPWLLPLALLLGLVGGWLLPRPGPAPGARPIARPAPLRVAASASPGTTRTAGIPASSAARPVATVPAAATAGRTALAASPRSTAPATPAATPVRPASSITGISGATPPSVLVVDSGRTASSVTRVVTVEPSGLSRPAADSVPGLVRPLVQLTRASLRQLGDSASPTRQVRLVASLRAEKSELLRLQRRVDSLLLALGAVPLANPAAAVQPSATAPDTARPRPLRRWSLLLTATPEQNYQQLRTPATDTLLAMRRNQERGRRGLNAALLGEYRLNQRVSLGAGLGYSRSSTELRVAERRTDVSVRYDTTTTHSVNVFSSTHTTYSVRLEQIPQLNPVFNPSGQVIGYDTVYITRPDTVYTTIVQNDTVRTTNKVVTPLIDKRESTVYRNLTPTYHFFTVPVLLRYRLTAAENSRWWADVALGGQFQFFLGGSQLVTEDGRSYSTERVRAGDGPFRPLNLALSGSLGVNYALTPRLSMSLAPSLRWQALSVYKPSTGLLQRSTATGLQIGVRWQL
jgi:hypothetical protein